MKLTIIPADGAVGEDGKFFLNMDLSSCAIPENVHALQWNGTTGWIEFNNTDPNEEITALPVWATCCVSKWDQKNNPPTPDPTPATAEQNRQIAVGRLQDTDWATIPDVADPNKSNPYLVNPADFVSYRNIIRPYAINPVDGDINWPTIPQAIWATV
jgi:hypothetical protein